MQELSYDYKIVHFADNRILTNLYGKIKCEWNRVKNIEAKEDTRIGT